MTLPPKILISWWVSTKLVELTESLLSALSTMHDALYHASVIYHTLNYASSRTKEAVAS